MGEQAFEYKTFGLRNKTTKEWITGLKWSSPGGYGGYGSRDPISGGVYTNTQPLLMAKNRIRQLLINVAAVYPVMDLEIVEFVPTESLSKPALSFVGKITRNRIIAKQDPRDLVRSRKNG
jgi:hypothetical protein